MGFRRTVILSLLLAGTLTASSVVEDRRAVATIRAGTAALTNAEKEDFLRTAQPLAWETLPVGTTQSIRARLDDGTLQHDVHVQTVDAHRDPNGPFRNFRDSYRYNIAAYRLASLVGFDRVPVSVERTVEDEEAAVTWWVDDVAMMEVEREEEGIEPPDPEDFDHQLWRVSIFSQLALNTDLNPGNVLITKDWDVWVIDFTRAFRIDHEIEREELGGRVGRSLYRAMRSLDEDTLLSELQPQLARPEIEAVLRGRDEIVEHFDEQAAARGEAAVFCDDH